MQNSFSIGSLMDSQEGSVGGSLGGALPTVHTAPPEVMAEQHAAARQRVKDALHQALERQYEGVQLLGCGGFGRVYSAYDPREGRQVRACPAPLSPKDCLCNACQCTSLLTATAGRKAVFV